MFYLEQPDQLALRELGVTDLVDVAKLPWMAVVALSPVHTADPAPTLGSLLMSPREFPWTHFDGDNRTGLTFSNLPGPHTVKVLPGHRDGWHGGVIETRARRPGCAGKETILLEAGRINEDLAQAAGRALVRHGCAPPEEYWD